MRYTLTIDADNDAFCPTEDERRAEVARILRHAATVVESHGLDECHLRDINGNRVGQLTLTED